MTKMKKKGIKIFIVALASFLMLVFCIVAASSDSTLRFIDPTPALDSSITILNPQSYPSIGENGTVMFNTTGQANLTITPVNSTYFDVDIQFLGLRCGDGVVNAQNDATSWYNASWNYLRKGKLYIQEIQNIHKGEYDEYAAY
jgi:hypothetical protein